MIEAGIKLSSKQKTKKQTNEKSSGQDGCFTEFYKRVTVTTLPKLFHKIGRKSGYCWAREMATYVSVIQSTGDSSRAVILNLPNSETL